MHTYTHTYIHACMHTYMHTYWVERKVFAFFKWKTNLFLIYLQYLINYIISIACYYCLSTCHKLFNSGLVKTPSFANAISAKPKKLSVQPNTYIHICMHACIHTCIHARTRTHAHAHTYIHTYIKILLIFLHSRSVWCETRPQSCVTFLRTYISSLQGVMAL
jgi:hypothetical protein